MTSRLRQSLYYHIYFIATSLMLMHGCHLCKSHQLVSGQGDEFKYPYPVAASMLSMLHSPFETGAVYEE